MKKIFFALSMLLTVGSAYSANPQSTNEPTQFTMPSAEVLTERLKKLGMEHFLEKSNLVNQLAGKEKVASGVVMAVELSLYDYTRELSPMMVPVMQMRKGEIIDALLEGNNAALQEVNEILK